MTMQEKKIATSVDILVNVGQYEHIQITKYAEKKITYDSSEEMVKKEDELTDELVSDVIRSMRSLPDKLGKKTNAVAAIEERIQKKIPAWLENGSEPNIANKAKEKYDGNVAKASAEVEAKKQKEDVKRVETEGFLGSKTPEKANKTTEKEKSKEVSLDDDLFGDN